jgi:hypothetical protein
MVLTGAREVDKKAIARSGARLADGKIVYFLGIANIPTARCDIKNPALTKTLNICGVGRGCNVLLMMILGYGDRPDARRKIITAATMRERVCRVDRR